MPRVEELAVVAASEQQCLRLGFRLDRIWPADDPRTADPQLDAAIVYLRMKLR